MLFDDEKQLAEGVFQVAKDVTGKVLLQQGYATGRRFGEVLFQRRVEAFKNHIGVLDGDERKDCDV